MEFKELKEFLPISDDAGLKQFIESAFDYRLHHKEESGPLATFMFNNLILYVENRNDNLISFVKKFAFMDYVCRDESLTDEEYEKAVDDIWRKQYLLFVEEKDKRAQ